MLLLSGRCLVIPHLLDLRPSRFQALALLASNEWNFHMNLKKEEKAIRQSQRSANWLNYNLNTGFSPTDECFLLNLVLISSFSSHFSDCSLEILIYSWTSPELLLKWTDSNRWVSGILLHKMYVCLSSLAVVIFLSMALRLPLITVCLH